MLGSLQGGCASEAAQAEHQPPAPAEPLPAPVPQQSTEELEQLVAPIALYPDALVAQILAAATYPTQIVEADRWLQQHPDLKGDALAKAVDAQSWDPGVKALTQFPGLLGMMDKNLSWTSSLGEAYVNGQQNVLDAVQVMRQRAQQAGNLKSTPQESVTTQGDAIALNRQIRKSFMCRNTIPGSSTVIPSRSTRVGLEFRASSSMGRGSSSAWELVSVFSVASAGGGTAGERIGTDTA